MFDNFKLTIAAPVTTASSNEEFMAGLCMVKINQDALFEASDYYGAVSANHITPYLDYDNGDNTWDSHVEISSYDLATFTLVSDTHTAEVAGCIRFMKVLVDDNNDVSDYYFICQRPRIYNNTTQSYEEVSFAAGSTVELRTNSSNIRKDVINSGTGRHSPVGNLNVQNKFFYDSISPDVNISRHWNAPYFFITDSDTHVWGSPAFSKLQNSIGPFLYSGERIYFAYFTVNTLDENVIYDMPNVSYNIPTSIDYAWFYVNSASAHWEGQYYYGDFAEYGEVPSSVAFATNGETRTGTSTTTAVTPAGLAYKLGDYVGEEALWTGPEDLIRSAQTYRSGIVQLATDVETITGTTATRAVTPFGLAACLDSKISSATESTAGVVELATVAESVAGVDTARAVTPAGLAAARPESVKSVSNTEIDLNASPYRNTSGTYILSEVSIVNGPSGEIGYTNYIEPAAVLLVSVNNEGRGVQQLTFNVLGESYYVTYERLISSSATWPWKVIVPEATHMNPGTVRLAEIWMAEDGINDASAVTPAGVKAHVDLRLVAASETESGMVKLATTAEAAAAADTTKAVTPAGISAAMASYGSSTNIVTYLDDNQYRQFGISGFHATWSATALGSTAPCAAANTSTAATASTTYMIPFVLPRAITMTNLSIVVATLAASSTCKIGLYETDNNSTTLQTTAANGRYRPTNILAQSGALDCSTAGTKTYTLPSAITLQPGVYFFAVIVSTAATLKINFKTTTSGTGVGEFNALWRDQNSVAVVPVAFTTTAPGTATSATFPSNPSVLAGTTRVNACPIVYFNYTLA